VVEIILTVVATLDTLLEDGKLKYTNPISRRVIVLSILGRIKRNELVLDDTEVSLNNAFPSNADVQALARSVKAHAAVEAYRESGDLESFRERIEELEDTDEKALLQKVRFERQDSLTMVDTHTIDWKGSKQESRSCCIEARV
jgi:hypothetical protein